MLKFKITIVVPENQWLALEDLVIVDLKRMYEMGRSDEVDHAQKLAFILWKSMNKEIYKTPEYKKASQ